MRVLDLFCGMGGWSIGFHREGFECVGLDIMDVGYPYELWNYDIAKFACDSKMGFDVVVASPPCAEFSSFTKAISRFPRPTRGPPVPEKGMILVKEAKRVIESIKPKWWALENVAGAVPHFAPLLGKPKLVWKPWYVWGQFPNFMFPTSNRPVKNHSPTGRMIDERANWDPLISFKRARIPIPLSLAMARACKAAMFS